MSLGRTVSLHACILSDQAQRHQILGRIPLIFPQTSRISPEFRIIYDNIIYYVLIFVPKFWIFIPYIYAAAISHIRRPILPSVPRLSTNGSPTEPLHSIRRSTHPTITARPTPIDPLTTSTLFTARPTPIDQPDRHQVRVLGGVVRLMTAGWLRDRWTGMDERKKNGDRRKGAGRLRYLGRPIMYLSVGLKPRLNSVTLCFLRLKSKLDFGDLLK